MSDVDGTCKKNDVFSYNDGKKIRETMIRYYSSFQQLLFVIYYSVDK
ncbi:hypothetical protein ACIQ34_20295 [Ureibacillus sp. NPDC094379]